MSWLKLNKVASPGAPPANTARVFLSSSFTPPALAVMDESGNVCRIGGLTTPDYRLIKVTTILNGTTTYTPTSGAQALLIECIGGGGAGGGAASSTGGTNSSIGGGGGGGGWAMKWLAALVSGVHTVAVGAGGTAGTAGNNAGNNGGNTTFADTGSTVVCQANGGTGGPGGGASSATIGGVVLGGAGGTAPTGDRTVQGQDGGESLRLTIATTGMVSGAGGPSALGFGGGAPSIIASGAGSTGRVHGGGGSGGADAATTNRQGGVGGNGLIRVWEYA